MDSNPFTDIQLSSFIDDTPSDILVAEAPQPEDPSNGGCLGRVHTTRDGAAHDLHAVLSSGFWMEAQRTVAEAADAFIANPSVRAVAVLDPDGKPRGVLARDLLLAELGRPYGRDVLARYPVTEVAIRVRSFPADTSVVAVAEEIGSDVRGEGETWFVAVDTAGRYAGLFSSKDVLVHLYERTRADVALARSIQGSIVRERTAIESEGLDIAGFSLMARGVGGDWCCAHQYSSGRWLVSVCDVSGKGISASLITAVIGGMFSIYDFNAGLSGFIRSLDAYMAKTFSSEKFVTGVFAQIDEATGEVLFCDMGHSMAFIRRGERFFALGSGTSNPPLGICAGKEPSMARFRLKSGDMLLACTDGVMEQRDKRGKEYGFGRLAFDINAAPHRSLEERASSVLESFKSHCEGADRGDDATLILVLRK